MADDYQAPSYHLSPYLCIQILSSKLLFQAMHNIIQFGRSLKNLSYLLTTKQCISMSRGQNQDYTCLTKKRKKKKKQNSE